MSKHVQNRSAVVPGDVLADDGEHTTNEGTYVDNEKIISSLTGTVEFRHDNSVKVNPEKGVYIPQEGDQVVGQIERVSVSSWNVDINCPYSAFLHLHAAVDEYVEDDADVADYFDMGDLLVGKVIRVTKGMDVKLSMEDSLSRKLTGGRVVEVAPSKVPRIIGRKGSMVDMIKNATGSKIVIGQNGRVWIDNGNIDVAAAAVEKVAREASRSDLSDRMETWLEQQTNQEVR